MRRWIEAKRKPAGFAPLAILLALFFPNAMAADLVVFHADSLAGPMRALKNAFEAAHPGITLALTPGVSKQLAERIANGEACDVFAAIGDPAKATGVSDVVNAVRPGSADARVNLSEAIRNAATVPGTARSATEATAFVAFLLSPEARSILKDTGQPPVVPALRRGAVPAEIR